MASLKHLHRSTTAGSGYAALVEGRPMEEIVISGMMPLNGTVHRSLD